MPNRFLAYLALSLCAAALLAGCGDDELGPIETAAREDRVTTREGVPVEIQVLRNDSVAAGGALEVTAVDLESAEGTATIDPDGRIVTYTPPPEVPGEDPIEDRFGYTISDGIGHSAKGLVRVTIIPVNEAPNADDDNATTTINRPVVIAVLTNDVDPEGDAIRVIGTTRPLEGRAAVAGDQITYTPLQNFLGLDSFTYSVADSAGNTASAFVQVEVVAPGEAPVAVEDTLDTDEDVPVTVRPLTNDLVPVGTLSLTGVSRPNLGTAERDDAGIVTYTPYENFNGNDEFLYTAESSEGWIITGRVLVTIRPVNDPPVANNDYVVTSSRPITIRVLANDDDVDGSALTVTNVGASTHGTTVINADFTVTYTPGAGFTAEDSFVYTAADFQGATATATVNVRFDDTCVGTLWSCDGDRSNGCETDVQTTDRHCGACGDRCHAEYTCASGTCVPACPENEGECDDNPTNGCEANLLTSEAHCGACGDACLPGQSCDAGACAGCGTGYEDCDGEPANSCETNVRTDPDHCGHCDTVCAAGENCIGGACTTCPTGFGDCDSDTSNGCETELVAHDACGSCTTACSAAQTCTSATCTGCATDRGNCDGDDSNGCEVNLATSAQSCGECGNGCATGESCQAGACGTSCGAGSDDCDGSAANGCEADLTSNATCGDCLTACAAETQVCNGASCDPCVGDTADCDDDPANACEADLTRNATCGACDVACAAELQTCDTGACTPCAAGSGDCDLTANNGCETDLTTHADCGACGTSCAAITHTCASGTCTPCAANTADCDGDAGNACEADLTSDTTCGSCTTSCTAPAVCTSGTCL